VIAVVATDPTFTITISAANVIYRYCNEDISGFIPQDWPAPHTDLMISLPEIYNLLREEDLAV
jgi:hypothetical protein